MTREKVSQKRQLFSAHNQGNEQKERILCRMPRKKVSRPECDGRIDKPKES